MYIEVRLDGNVYKSGKESDLIKAEAFASKMYDIVNDLHKLRIDCENGDIVMFPKEAAQRAVIIVHKD